MTPNQRAWLRFRRNTPAVISAFFLTTLITLVSHAASKEEQGKVQGAAGALESLGRTIGPVWGNGALQRFGEASPSASAAAAFVVTTLVVLTYHPPSPE